MHTQDETQPVVENAPGGEFRLIVLRGAHTQTVALPATGSVSIGRGHEVDVPIDDNAISRRHAMVHLGPVLRIEDLGSINGTRLRGHRLDPHTPMAFAPGDLIDLGSTVILVQPRVSSLRPRRIWSHDYFEGRVEEECLRATRTGAQFTVVRVHLEGGSSPAVTQDLLASALRTEDCCAVYGPNEYELLLFDTPGAVARPLLEGLVAQLGRQQVACRVGVASFPLDGQTPERLIDRACAQVAGEPEAAATPKGEVARIVRGEAMRGLYDLIDRIADSPVSVLLQGETGVGKEVVAEAVHVRSSRAKGPFVRINCAAFSETLFESELFGHERGAFSGASQSKPGLIETAAGGTLFLDEIGEMPLALQAKLLRVLETREVMRVGAVKVRPVDVRFVAATNQDLEARAAQGQFRADLYFRLNGITLQIPPLRDRLTEIPGLVALFLEQALATSQARRTPPRVTPDALEVLGRYRWPGNIRELKNMVVRALLLCGTGPSIGIEHLPMEKLIAPLAGSAPRVGPSPDQRWSGPLLPVPPGFNRETGPIVLKPRREALDRDTVVKALEKSGGNQGRAAALLGVSRRTMVTRIKELGIARPRDDES